MTVLCSAALIVTGLQRRVCNLLIYSEIDLTTFEKLSNLRSATSSPFYPFARKRWGLTMTVLCSAALTVTRLTMTVLYSTGAACYDKGYKHGIRRGGGANVQS